MPTPCTICAATSTATKVASLVAEGVSDRAIAAQLNLGRMSVQRHRTRHILAPAKAVAEMAGKGADAAAQRAQTMAAAQAGDPAAFLGLAAIVADLRRAQDRLERMAGVAEQSGQGVTVATLTGQQLRAAELRAKIGGAGAFGRGEPSVGAGTVGSPITIIIQGHDVMGSASGPVIEGEAVPGITAQPTLGGQVTVQLGD